VTVNDLGFTASNNQQQQGKLSDLIQAGGASFRYKQSSDCDKKY